jgi:fimbrial isopeptide formation D2 family protein
MPEIYEAENGLAVRNLGNNGYSSSFNGIHWSTSHFATVKDMANSSYTFTYSATGAGATYFFGSPVPYDTPAPAKYIDEINKTENRATSETKYNYIITQRIPENFSTESDILTFSSLFSTYSNIKPNRKYTEFSISDTLNANLLVPERNQIKVYQGDTDITSKFQITTEGQKVTASIINLNDSTIYGATIRLIIPVTTKNTVATKVINNEATNSYTNTSNTPGRKTSNTTSTNIYHKLTVRHIDKETGKEISDTVVKEYNHGDEYVSDMASGLPTGYQLISTPDNAKGIMNNNVTVIYYYNIPKNPSTLDHDLVPFAIVLGSTAVVAYGLFRIVAKRR